MQTFISNLLKKRKESKTQKSDNVAHGEIALEIQTHANIKYVNGLIDSKITYSIHAEFKKKLWYCHKWSSFIVLNAIFSLSWCQRLIPIIGNKLIDLDTMWHASFENIFFQSEFSCSKTGTRKFKVVYFHLKCFKPLVIH